MLWLLLLLLKVRQRWIRCLFACPTPPCELDGVKSLILEIGPVSPRGQLGDLIS